MGEVGNIKEGIACRIDWEIRDLPSLSTKKKYFYNSPTFKGCDGYWNLRLYPNGSSDESSGYVSLYLNKINYAPSPLLVDFEISIKDRFGYKYATGIVQEKYKKNECVGWAKYYKRSKLLENMDFSSPESKLIVSCIFFCKKLDEEASDPLDNNIENHTTPKLKRPQKTLIQNMKDLFLSSLYSDILIKVKDQEFPAHKGILASRSSVFKRLMMTKNNSDILIIEGFAPRVVRHLLSYIYCGEVKDITIDNVFDLYTVSSEYDIKDFKEECERFLMDNMTAEALCKVLNISKKYNSLKDSKLALMYLEKNASNILTTDEWKKFESENITAAEDILKTIVLENALKIKM